MPGRQETHNNRGWNGPRDDDRRLDSDSDWSNDRESREYRGDAGDRGDGRNRQQQGWRLDYNYGGQYGDRGSDRGAGRADRGAQDMPYRSYGDSYEDQPAGNRYQTESVTGLRTNWVENRGGASDREWNQPRSNQPEQRGQFAGRGPKGYQRADERIAEEINEALTHDPHIDATEIEVKVSHGEVTLSGTVTDRNAKRRAEDLAERISGVHDIHNQIRVQRNQQSEHEAGRQHQIKGKPATTARSRSNGESKSA